MLHVCNVVMASCSSWESSRNMNSRIAGGRERLRVNDFQANDRVPAGILRFDVIGA
jgi:hypothetical protein